MIVLTILKHGFTYFARDHPRIQVVIDFLQQPMMKLQKLDLQQLAFLRHLWLLGVGWPRCALLASVIAVAWLACVGFRSGGRLLVPLASATVRLRLL